MALINMSVEAVRRGAIQVGYDAHRAGVFVANPYLPGDKMYEPWGDGYWLGVQQSQDEDRLAMGIHPPANDN